MLAAARFAGGAQCSKYYRSLALKLLSLCLVARDSEYNKGKGLVD